jgi:hypothetical protein
MCQAGHAISSLGSSLMASRAKADAEALLAEIRVIDGAQAAAPAIHYNVVDRNFRTVCGQTCVRLR